MAKAKSPAVLKAEETIEVLNLWIQFVVEKVVGITSVTIGGLDLLDPSLLPTHLQQMHHPGYLLGGGLGLLGSKVVVRAVKAMIG